MRPELPADSPEAWLQLARSDLAIAAGPQVEQAHPSAYCFHAQQATEKAIKAVYVHRAIQPLWIHDIKQLLDDLSDLDIPDHVKRSARLTPFATFHRYPGEFGLATQQTVTEAVDLARAVVDWATLIIEP